MPKRKDGRRPKELQESKADRIYAAAMAIVETDAELTREKTERLRALRLAKAAEDRQQSRVSK
jgi:hypothetical protein